MVDAEKKKLEKRTEKKNRTRNYIWLSLMGPEQNLYRKIMNALTQYTSISKYNEHNRNRLK